MEPSERSGDCGVTCFFIATVGAAGFRRSRKILKNFKFFFEKIHEWLARDSVSCVVVERLRRV
jgi:hypothetical protein